MPGTQIRRLRGGFNARARESLAVNLAQSRGAAKRAAIQADKLRNTKALMHLHEAMAALDEAVKASA